MTTSTRPDNRRMPPPFGEIMSRFKLLPGLTLAVLSVGCAESPTSTNVGPVFITVTGPIDAGSMANAELVNESGAAVRIGAIGCQLGMDKLGSTGWTAVPREGDICPQPEFTVGNFESYPFDFAAPASPGRYRIHTYVEGDAVLSNPFSVR